VVCCRPGGTATRYQCAELVDMFSTITSVLSSYLLMASSGTVSHVSLTIRPGLTRAQRERAVVSTTVRSEERHDFPANDSDCMVFLSVRIDAAGAVVPSRYITISLEPSHSLPTRLMFKQRAYLQHWTGLSLYQTCKNVSRLRPVEPFVAVRYEDSVELTPYNTSRPGREELPNSSKERAGAQYEPSPVSMRRRVAYHRPNTPRARPLRSSSGLRVVRVKQYVVPTVWNLNRAFRNSVGRSSERPSTRKQCVWFGTLCLGSRLGVPRQRNLE
jgi:hypothetical protein